MKSLWPSIGPTSGTETKMIKINKIEMFHTLLIAKIGKGD